MFLKWSVGPSVWCFDSDSVSGAVWSGGDDALGVVVMVTSREIPVLLKGNNPQTQRIMGMQVLLLGQPTII